MFRTSRGWAWLAAFVASLCALWAEGATGPMVRLASGDGSAAATSVSDFMYFVALIAPAPVFIGASPGSTQTARLVSTTRKAGKSSFATTCEFEFSGSGLQESLFDLAPEIRRHEQELKAGGTLGRQLESIIVNGPGAVTVEAKGSISNEARIVDEVKIKFATRSQYNFVSITLCDVKWVNGRFAAVNEIVAKVTTLAFKREPGIPKMDITVASLKDKNASDGLWSNFKGAVTGAAVNLFIPPLVVQKGGNLAMLDFGLALSSGVPTFTFPSATNLLAKPAAQVSAIEAGPQ